MDDVIEVNLRGFELKLRTKAGVFSKKGVDGGSALLIDHLQIEDGTMIADMGCGSGIIGFIAAKLNPHGHVHLLDVNVRIVELAKANAELNDFRNVEVYLSDLFSAVDSRTYHQILSNPAQHLGNEFLEEAAKECHKHLKPGGSVLWVVQKHLKQFTQNLFENQFGNCKTLVHGTEYALLKATKK